MQFQINKIMCHNDCRNGLTQAKQECTHINNADRSNLAIEFVTHERSRKIPSELFTTLSNYVEDVDFWSACLCFDQKLHRHQPKWVRRHFVELTMKQLRHLVHVKMNTKSIKLFKKRASQLLTLCENQSEEESLMNELEYLFGKQFQLQ